MIKHSVSICIPAYNEEKNLKKLLDALLKQKTQKAHISKIGIVSSASTDNTVSIVEEYMKKDSRIMLIRQEKREGKASAINAFLRSTNDHIIVIQSADTLPTDETIEHLCVPIIENDGIGMTGGAPYPIDDPEKFLGYIIHAWWWFHRNIPRFGEIIAFRNILGELSTTTAVDEAYIQAKIVQKKLKVVYVDKAVVFNKGADSVTDLIKQRRRVFNGHARLMQEENVHIDNMTKSSLRLLLFKYEMKNLKEFMWFTCGIGIEAWARILGAYDLKIKGHNPFIWDTAKSTKNLVVKFRKGAKSNDIVS